MGADFLVVATEMPRESSKIAVLSKIAFEIQDIPIKTVFDILDDLVGDSYGDPRGELYDLLKEAYDYLWGRPRDVATLNLGGQDYWLAGGMSWGDDPSEAFTMICRIDRFSIR